MTFLLGFIASIIMILLWSSFFYTRDPHKERARDLLITITAGFAAFLLSFVIILPTAALFDIDLETIDFLFYEGNLTMVILLAGIEELSKLIVLRVVVFSNKRINEHADGVLFGGLVGLGFAGIENFFYAMNINLASGLARALLIPLLHGGTGAILGFFMIEKKLKDRPAHQHSLWIGLVVTTFFHALYNYFIIMADRFEFAFVMTMVMWLGLLLAVGYVENTSRHRDFDGHKHTDEETASEKKEEGKTLALLGIFCGLMAIFLIFPVFFGTIGIILGTISAKQGAKLWGKRAVLFCTASLLLSYITNIFFYFY